MIFDRVYFNLDDGKYYVENIGTNFDDFWTSLNSKGTIGKAIYRLIFDIIVGVSKLTHKCKKAYIIFD